MGVEEEQVYYFDWWEELAIDNGFIAYTPAQHFSGRGLGDGNKTLWGSWVIKAGEHSVFLVVIPATSQALKILARNMVLLIWLFILGMNH